MTGGNYVELLSKTGVKVRLESDLKYWQIYTPQERTAIAVEPVSFGGNLYEIMSANNKDIELQK